MREENNTYELLVLLSLFKCDLDTSTPWADLLSKIKEEPVLALRILRKLV